MSSYLPELVGVCDRIAVMSRGRLDAPRPAAEWTEHALLMAASGARVALMNARRLLDERGALIGLVLVSALFAALVGPQFLHGANLELMARQAVIVWVAALGMTMVIAAGGIDLSVGSIVALSTVVTAQLLHSTSPMIAVLGAVALSAACGAVNGVLITTLRVVPFIVTLGTMLVVRGAAKGLADERRIEAPMTWLNGLLRTAGDGRGLLVPWGVWLTAILAVLVAATLNYTRFGRHLFAIGSNERTARLCGVRVDRCKVAVYTLVGRAGRRWPACSSSRGCRWAIRRSRSASSSM